MNRIAAPRIACFATLSSIEICLHWQQIGAATVFAGNLGFSPGYRNATD
ncbi:hypothetical protein [Cupriavidus sp. TMH.W2]